MTESDTEGFELIYKDLLPKITVKDPVTHDSWDKGKFTTYLICIKTDHPAFHLRLSAVRRRFSELLWLYRVLKENHPHVHFPSAPPKKVFSERFEQEFINSRMRDVQDFLNELLITDTVLSDAAFHFFVQTDLTTDEIDEYLNGTLSESIVKEAWRNAGHLHTSSYIVNTTTIPPEPQEIVMNEEDLHHVQQTSRSLTESTHVSFKTLSVSIHASNGPESTAVNLGEAPAGEDVLCQTEDASTDNDEVRAGNDTFQDGEVLTQLGDGVVKITLPVKTG